MASRAIVFVANDKVYDQTVAFLESIRRNSPGIPLVCIPFDDRLARIDILRDVYGFSYHNDFDFRGLMEIAKILKGREAPRLRKLAAFTVPVDEFLSLDTDIIVLQDLTPLFGHTGHTSEIDILHFDVSPGCTYHTIEDPLIAHTKEINTGAFVSTKDIFDYEHHIFTIMQNFSDFKRLANIAFDDQPFGAFVFDLDRRRYRSVEHICEYSENTWYKHNLRFQDGVLVDSGTGRPTALIHYAGVSHAEGYANAERFRDIALHYQEAGERRVAAALAARQTTI